MIECSFGFFCECVIALKENPLVLRRLLGPDYLKKLENVFEFYSGLIYIGVCAIPKDLVTVSFDHNGCAVINMKDLEVHDRLEVETDHSIAKALSQVYRVYRKKGPYFPGIMSIGNRINYSYVISFGRRENETLFKTGTDAPCSRLLSKKQHEDIMRLETRVLDLVPRTHLYGLDGLDPTDASGKYLCDYYELLEDDEINSAALDARLELLFRACEFFDIEGLTFRSFKASGEKMYIYYVQDCVLTKGDPRDRITKCLGTILKSIPSKHRYDLKGWVRKNSRYVSKDVADLYEKSEKESGNTEGTLLRIEAFKKYPTLRNLIGFIEPYKTFSNENYDTYRINSKSGRFHLDIEIKYFEQSTSVRTQEYDSNEPKKKYYWSSNRSSEVFASLGDIITELRTVMQLYRRM